MQELKLACLLLITSSALVASDTAGGNKKSPTLSTTTIGKKSSYDDVAAAALSQPPNTGTLQKQTEHNRTLTKRTYKPYKLTELQRALVTPTTGDGVIKKTSGSDSDTDYVWSSKDFSSDDEQWCPHHDRDESCYRCTGY